MILTIDIGNTNIELGVVDEQGIVFQERISTDIDRTELEYAVLIKNALEVHSLTGDEITGSIMSSVVPPLVHIIKSAIKKLIGITPMVVGAGLKTGLDIKIDNPKTLGADIVVDSVAAKEIYGAPCIVIDMGTATTITVISKNGDYVGGVIVPGVRSSLEALVSDTSQLPRVSLSSPKRFICTNTIDCMKSGIINGQAALVDGMIDRFWQELGYRTNVVATGGLSRVIIPKCNHDITLNNDLMMVGLKLIYDRNH
ncbi:MAG: type III pantothenate kinase [Lachnospiraceae bacterium]|nr:type III pantothenate kinase [Lachnospiraceae bacterium]MEE3379080.1 type III pantothenate kinase [Lachnospiraceae bacterium]MEE3433514.1 type III pantothenate kinase [Lachnospiraceae bacterium]